MARDASTGPRLGGGRLAGLIRLGHPFPSALNAGVTLALASVAGAPPTVALRLAGSMLAVQVSIGSLNDLVDADLDRGRKLGKPIPRGMATRQEALLVAIAAFGLGIALSAPSGPLTALVAAAGAGSGYVYDLRLSRTAWSWLPLAVALPLVPVHAWLGATGSVPAELLAVLPAGWLAGAGLALANGLADLERDRAIGVRAAVVRLGPRLAWLAHASALAGAIAIAVVASAGFGAGDASGGDSGFSGLPATVGLIAVGLIAVGAALVASRPPGLRERGWELEAIGVAALAIAWIGGLGRFVGR